MPQSQDTPNHTSGEAIPEFIAHYRILRRLGKGGMGEVFLAEDTKQHGRKVALKILLSSLTHEPNSFWSAMAWHRFRIPIDKVMFRLQSGARPPHSKKS